MESKNLRLETLHITNFATFKSETISFKNGLNTIVGETGSGKSLILDALQLILGQRADKKVIRKGSEFSTVEAIFSTSSLDIQKYFMENGYPFEDDQIVIKRIIQSSGKSKNFINHQSCTIKDIQDFAQEYIDFVGQFSNQKLLNDRYQIEILDSYAKLEELRNSYQQVYAELKLKMAEFDEISSNESDRLRKIDFLNFQIEEIENLEPTAEKEIELTAQKKYLQTFEKRMTSNQEIISYIDNDSAISELLMKVKAKLQDASLYPNENLDFIDECLNYFSDLSSRLTDEMTQEFDLELQENLIDQLDRYQKLKRKFGPEISDVIENYNNFVRELLELKNSQNKLNDYQKQIQTLTLEAKKLASLLSKKRSEACPKFSNEIVTKLKKLNMADVKIKMVIHSSAELSSNGCDKLLFTIETNPGEGYFLLQDIASGGELSRILLVMREVHARNNNNISIFLFDEIDTGIGGTTAVSMGEELRDIAANSQVIAITHLPQIAQFADFLIEVSKKTEGVESKRTESFIKEYQSAKIKKFAKEMTPLN